MAARGWSRIRSGCPPWSPCFVAVTTFMVSVVSRRLSPANISLFVQRVIALLDENPDLQLKDIKDFLQTEYDLTVTVSTISRQLSRANHARARRPGYKGKRPDLQPSEPLLSAQGQPQYGLADAAVIEQPRQSQSLATSNLQPAHVPQQERSLMLKCPYFAAVPQRYLSHPYCQNAWPTARDAKCVVSPHPNTPPPFGPKKKGERKEQSDLKLYPLGPFI